MIKEKPFAGLISVFLILLVVTNHVYTDEETKSADDKVKLTHILT